MQNSTFSCPLLFFAFCLLQSCLLSFRRAFHPVKTQQMIRHLFVINTQNQVVALAAYAGKKYFNGIVNVSAFRKKL